jgi:hypothetical protein
VIERGTIGPMVKLTTIILIVALQNEGESPARQGMNVWLDDAVAIILPDIVQRIHHVDVLCPIDLGRRA